jgi:hypothetical protein
MSSGAAASTTPGSTELGAGAATSSDTGAAGAMPAKADRN